MSSLLFINTTGAGSQAEAVLAYLRGHDGIESSWDGNEKDYAARPTVARWENCREQGYVVSMSSARYDKQINIAFFEHRNTDNICAIKWDQCTINAPTIDTAEFGDDVYKDKYDTSFDVNYGEAEKMASLIMTELTTWWDSNADGINS